MKNYLRWSLGSAVALALALGASAESRAVETLKIRLSWLPFGMHAAWFYATHKGLYKAEGVELEIEDGRGSALTVSVVGGGGGVDLGEAAVSTMAPATAKGAPLRALATYLPGNDLGVLVPSETGAKTVKDLETKGISIIYTPGSLEAPFMDAFLKAGGSNRDKIKLIGVDATAKISSYMSGAGGSVVTSTPFIEPVLRKQKPSNVIKFADYGLALPSIGLIARDDTIAAKGESIRKIVVITANAWGKILGDANAKKEAVDAMIALRPNAKLDPWLIDAQIEEYRPLFYSDATKGKPIGWQAEAIWATAVKVMQDADVLPKTSKPGDFYTNKFYPGGAS